ncbi:MAG: hypothetical protein H8E33_01310 [Candidatus Cloacimonetes bacterium]|nr:hypothetical protein [Candidatus Cloacimonadota bacterium]
MQWYFIILTFFFNILIGICLFYSLLLLLFHPKKRRKILFINLPQGIFYILKNKLANYISKQFEIYLECNKDKFEDSKLQEISLDFSEKSSEKIRKNRWFKLLPKFISDPILSFIFEICYYLSKEFFSNFAPNLAKRYKLKEKIFAIFSEKNIEFIEVKTKLFLTKPLFIIGGIVGLLFGIFNLIFTLIF